MHKPLTLHISNNFLYANIFPISGKSVSQNSWLKKYSGCKLWPVWAKRHIVYIKSDDVSIKGTSCIFEVSGILDDTRYIKTITGGGGVFQTQTKGTFVKYWFGEGDKNTCLAFRRKKCIIFPQAISNF